MNGPCYPYEKQLAPHRLSLQAVDCLGLLLESFRRFPFLNGEGNDLQKSVRASQEDIKEMPSQRTEEFGHWRHFEPLSILGNKYQSGSDPSSELPITSLKTLTLPGCRPRLLSLGIENATNMFLPIHSHPVSEPCHQHLTQTSKQCGQVGR